MGANHAMPLEAAPPGPAADLHPVEGSWHDFTSLWLPLQDGLFRIALLIAPDRADAEDAVSDTMAATFGPWQKGRVDSLDAYARRALVNRLTGRGRRRSVADRHRRTRSGDSRGRGRSRTRSRTATSCGAPSPSCRRGSEPRSSCGTTRGSA